MGKILFVATIDEHIRHFHLPFLKWFKENGYEVHVASNGMEQLPNVDCKFNLPFERSPFKANNFLAYKKLKSLLNLHNYKLIHCHTPMGGVVTRLAANKSRKNGTRVIYTAHGFHFYKGAPLKNWALYYPIEYLLSGATDTLVTINKEDYSKARQTFKTKDIKYIPGVGVDLEKFIKDCVKKEAKRTELGIAQDSFCVLSVGELNENKNHEVIIKAIAKLNNPQISYIICGVGESEDKLKKLIKSLNLESQIKLVGYRKDIVEICKISDVFAFPSLREGLPLSLMEAMASGLPTICSRIRGNVDLVNENKGGFLVEPRDIDGYAEAIKELYNSPILRKNFSQYNLEYIKAFSFNEVLEDMTNLYKKHGI